MLRKATSILMPYVAMALVITFVLLFVLKVPLSRLDVPYEYFGDVVDKLAQVNNVAQTGWLFHNDRLGYPFGYDRLDFPRFDSLNYAIMGPIAAFTGHPGMAMNLYYLAGFYAIGFMSFFCLRRLSMKAGPAFVCSLLFSFLPYHVGRSVGHITNGAYFLIPPAVLVLVWLAGNRLELTTPDARRRCVVALIVAILVPLQTPYNGVFFACLAAVAGAIALSHRINARALLATFAILFCVASTFFIEQMPGREHQRSRDGHALIADRSPVDAEFYSLHLNQVLLPDGAHRLLALAQAKHDFDDDMLVPDVEFRNQYIGALGILGLLALFWSLARAFSPAKLVSSDELESTVRIAALLAIAILLLAISSGVGTLIAYFVTSKIRAYNRILPFFAFCCLIGTGWMLQLAMDRIRMNVVRHAALGVIGIIGLLDVTPRLSYANRDRNIARFDLDRAFYAEMEYRLTEGAAVFQIPAVWYPEHLPLNRMNDYEEFKPWMFTRSLKFSYGGANGRPGYAWGRALERMQPELMQQQLQALGFSAILVDTSAFEDEAAQNLTSALTQALSQPAFVSSDRRLWLFTLDNCCTHAPAQIDPARLPKAVSWAIDAPSMSFSAGALGTQYLISGWHNPEEWGTWSDGSDGRLRAQLIPPPTGSLHLTLDIRALVGPKLHTRHVRVECRDKKIGEADFSNDESQRTLHLEVPLELIGPEGLLDLHFVVDSQDSTPTSAGVGSDVRQLGIGLSAMRIEQANNAPHAD